MPTTPAPIRVQVANGALRWPDFCACCGGPADTRLQKGHPALASRRAVSRAAEWAAPYCSDCLSHATRYAEAERIRRRGYQTIAIAWSIGLVIVLLVWFVGVRFLESRVGSMAAKGAVLLFAALVVAVTYQSAAHLLYQVRVDRQRMRERADKFTSSKCCNQTVAVVPQPTEGEGQTFDLHHPRFAASFMRLNGGRRMT